MEKSVIRLTFKKETKGTVVYEDRESTLCKSVYLLKDGVGSPHPKQIKITVEEDS